MVCATHRRLVVTTALLSAGLTAVVLTVYPRMNWRPTMEGKDPKLNSRDIPIPTPFPSTVSLNNVSDSQLAVLEAALREKLRDAASIPDMNVTSDSCVKLGVVNYKERECSAAKGNCLRTSIPDDPGARIKELLFQKYMSIPNKYRDVLQEMRSHVKGHYDFLVVTGFSSNHYYEGQAALKNYHNELLPYVKNMTVIVYDLGLRKAERQDLEKYCRCTVISFPFDKLPPHFRNLRCFAWKPFILNAHIEQTEVIFWGDTSVRVKNRTLTQDVIAQTKKRGVQQHANTGPNVWLTIPSLFEAFGDSPCVHWSFLQVAGGFLLYHREPLVQQAVLEPLLACVVNAKCICPPNQRQLNYCRKPRPNHIGVCNRNDQSAMTLVLARLFREKFKYVAVHLYGWAVVKRGGRAKYFDELKKRSTEKKKT